MEHQEFREKVDALGASIVDLGKALLKEAKVKMIDLAEGNQGSLVFLNKLTQNSNIQESAVIAIVIVQTGMKGADLCVLWNDLGGRDLTKVREICKKVPSYVLIDACSRQDRSGRELIAEYMKK